MNTQQKLEAMGLKIKTAQDDSWPPAKYPRLNVSYGTREEALEYFKNDPDRFVAYDIEADPWVGIVDKNEDIDSWIFYLDGQDQGNNWGVVNGLKIKRWRGEGFNPEFVDEAEGLLTQV